jgi:antibiotic biosynthesis monooxygenase (ABM) superfamily enzyme
MSEINNLPQNMPLTTIVRHTIKQGAEKEFEEWFRAIGKKVSAFKGFKGKYLIPPKKGASTNEYTVAFQFENIETLTFWMDSEERKEEVKKLKSFSQKEMELEHQEGIDFWFTNSDEEAKKPPKWKMSLLTWLAVFPGVALLSLLYRAIFPSFPTIALTLFVTLTLVPLLTWVLMPNIVIFFKKWLF